jgi:glycerophosphoryl diester phosphodiesterase
MRQRGDRASLVAALLVALTCVATAAERSLVAAHRGGAALAPENSLSGFRNALALGVDALEFDLHLTRDGEVVVIHDPRLDRTTTLSGAVRDRTLAELRTAHLKTRDGQVTTERVPTLAAVLDLARERAVEVLPEIKVGEDGSPYPGIEDKVLALLRARGLLDRATIQAFQPETLRRLRAIQSDVRMMLLVSRRRVQDEGVPPAEAVRWARDVGATDLGMDFHLISAGVVNAARGLRIRLSAWTVNEEADMKRMFALGVDVVMSDRPDVAKRLRGGD